MNAGTGYSHRVSGIYNARHMGVFDFPKEAEGIEFSSEKNTTKATITARWRLFCKEAQKNVRSTRVRTQVRESVVEFVLLDENCVVLAAGTYT